jgi:4-hydroxy-tetrahydrodipicolinate reductase
MRVLINGINGRMGRTLIEVFEEESDTQVVAGIDQTESNLDPVTFNNTILPIFNSPGDVTVDADVIIDFSNYEAVVPLLDFASKKGIPTVICTTALGARERDALRDAAKVIPVFNSSNMSLGINVVAKMSQLAVPSMESDFNIEIIEKHHNKKVDSPSGTAILLADAINEKCAQKKDYIYGRHSKNDECKITDMGIHAIRGGTLPGQHTVLFLGPDETIEITHTVYSRKIFALGAAKAAHFIEGKSTGMYSMDDLIG